MVHIKISDISELPDLPGPENEYIRVARLSLIEQLEQSAIDEVRLKHEGKKSHKHDHKHRGGWHSHARDHKHGHESINPKPELPNGSPSDPSCSSPGSPPPYEQTQEPLHEAPLDGRKHGPPPHGPHPHGPPPHGPPPHGPPPHGLPPHGPPPHGHTKEPLGKRKWRPPPFIKDPNAPEDKGYFVLATIAIFGLVHMMPFMFFFTANEYWMYKFRNTTSESTDANDRTYLQTNFASLTRLTVTAPGVICNFIAAVGGHKIGVQIRVFGVLAIHSLILIGNAVFVNINTDDWQIQFFVITMLLQLIMSCAMSLGGSGSMGLISKLPPRYMKAQLIGEGGAGVFSALLRLISIFSTPSTVSAALMYFVTGSVLMVGTSFLFYCATQTKFFKFYTGSSKEEQKQKLRNVGDFKGVLKLLWPLILLSSLSMLVPAPSINQLVVSEYYGTDNVWGTKYFVTVCSYIIPSIAGLVGRGIFNYIDYDCPVPVLYLLIIPREIIFGALTFLSNAKPRHHLPVLLIHDWQYGLMMAGNSLTQGFTMNLMMLKSMRTVPKDRIELGMMVNMFFMSVLSAATSPLGVLAVDLL